MLFDTRRKGTSTLVEQQAPISVQIATTQRVVEVGFRTILESAPAPLAVTTTTATDRPEPDVVLFDVILMHEGDTSGLDVWLSHTATTVIAIDRTLRPQLGAQARARGVEWSIHLGICDLDLVRVILEAREGTLQKSTVAQEWDPHSHLGAEFGLSPRQSLVLELVAQGLSNHEICQRLHLSINSIKTYIRSAYRKIDVSNRPQAVIWAMQHGFPTGLPQSRYVDSMTA